MSTNPRTAAEEIEILTHRAETRAFLGAALHPFRQYQAIALGERFAAALRTNQEPTQC